VRASQIGAHLDSNLQTGGGTDDTLTLQRILNSATSSKPLRLIIDGPALVSGLNVSGATTIECSAGAGFYLKDGSSRAVIRNANRSRKDIRDEHITIRGCFINGNRDNQPSANLPRPDMPNFPFPSNKEPDGTYMSGLQFLGVNDLTLENMTLWNIRSFGALIANANLVAIRGITIDDGGGPDPDVSKYVSTDGLHFKGPLHFVTIDSMRVRVGDDAVAFNANDYETDDVTTRNDFGPYVGQGPMSDILVNDMILMPGQVGGIRLLSTTERIDRVAITNVVGSIRTSFLQGTRWLNKQSFGNIGVVSIENVHVDTLPIPSGTVYDHVPRNFMELDSSIQVLSIRNLSTVLVPGEQLVKLGPHAEIGLFDLDVVAVDPHREGAILKLSTGAVVKHLVCSLMWEANDMTGSKDPIVYDGGIIKELTWVNTAPTYVDALVLPPAHLRVHFSQKLKGIDSVAGVLIKVSQKPVGVARVAQTDDAATVDYVVDAKINRDDQVSFAYDERQGGIQNFSGIPLRTVPETLIAR
jgi:hypothetical protein